MKRYIYICAIALSSCGPDKDNPRNIVEDIKPPAPAVTNSGFKGQVMHALGGFDVTVDSLELWPKITTKTTNVDPGPEAGFVIVNVTYKNTSSETISPFAGSVVVINSDEIKEFGEIQPIMERGWTAFGEGIGPGLEGEIRYAFKVPRSIKGQIFYMPEATQPKQMIACGSI